MLDPDDEETEAWALAERLRRAREDLADRKARRDDIIGPRRDRNWCCLCGSIKCCDKLRTRYEDAQREWTEAPGMYIDPPPDNASVDWTPESMAWARRWEEYAQLKSGLYFFAAMAAVGEEIAEWAAMQETGFTL